jgi:hypothetical protein
MESDARLVNNPNSVGIVPDKLIDPKPSPSRFVNDPNSFGIVPDKLV